MEIVVIGNFCLCVLVAMIGVFIGLDMKKWTSWLIVIYGFLSGFFVGNYYYDVRRGGMLGGIFAFAVIYAGATIFGYRQRYKGFTNTLLSRYVKDTRPSLLQKILRKLLDK